MKANQKPNGPQKNSKDPGYLTESWTPIRSIRNGMIINDRGEMITGVKIQPRNIFILDPDSQNNLLISVKNFYNMIDFEFWLVIADRPVDITVYLSQMQLLYNQTTDPIIRKLINQDLEKGNMFINNNVVDTEYFILFKEKNTDLLQKKVRLLINGLASSGLVAGQTTNADLRVILDNFLNAGRTFSSGVVIPQ